MITVYQLLPRLFTNTKKNLVKNGSIEENGCGKFAEITPQALRAIKRMGVTHVWFTGVLEHATQTDYSDYGIALDSIGIVKGKAGSPYAIKDYYDVDPDLAVDVKNRRKELEQLISRTHKEGLKVVIDFVPNHVARNYKSDSAPRGVKDLGAEDRTDWYFSADNNFYYFPNDKFLPQFDAKGYEEFPAKATGNDCFTPSPSVNDWYETVKLNYGVDYLGGRTEHFSPIPDTWKKMCNILLFWAKKGVDGFRCDMAEMVPVAFWHWAIPTVKASFPNIVFIAEVYNPSEYRNYISYGCFDYLYDKVGLYDTLKSVSRGERPASDITACWQSVNDIQSHMLHFLENHDEQRIASDFFLGAAEKAFAAVVVSSTLTSAPFMLYAGQELGERGMDSEGFSGLDGRTTIFDYWTVDTLARWNNKGSFDAELLTEKELMVRNFYQKLLTLCQKESALSEGETYDMMWLNYQNPYFDATKHFAYFRKSDEEIILVVANFSEESSLIGLSIAQHAMNWLGFSRYQKVRCTELLTDKKWKTTIDEDELFFVTVEAKSAVLVRLNIVK